jgi:hypothetical protein
MIAGSVTMVWFLTNHEACGGLAKALATIRENYPAHVPHSARSLRLRP